MTYARLIAIVLAFAVPAAPAAAGTIAKPACARELAVTETSLLKTLVRMQGVDNARPIARMPPWWRRRATCSSAAAPAPRAARTSATWTARSTG
jgi:hypothetical protein